MRPWPSDTLIPLVVGLFWLLCSPRLSAEEAVYRNGQRLEGKLVLNNKGELHFTSPEKTDPIPLSALHHVRFPLQPVTPFRVASAYRVVLHGGESFTAQLLGLEEDRLVLRTVWGDRLAVPRTMIEAVRQLPGWAVLFEEDFEGELPSWKLTGRPGQGRPATSGQSSLLLDAPGQEIEHVLPAPLHYGRIGVNFDAIKQPAGAEWLLEAEFQDKEHLRKLSVHLAGNGPHYRVDVPGITGKSQDIPRTPGWHRLTLQFSASSLRVVVDDSVLWHTLERGPGGPLVKWRLVCGKGKDGKPASGVVAFDDAGVSQASDEPRRPPGDDDQDEVWLLGGDQLFGRIARLDGRQVVLKGRFGEVALPWSKVRGVYLRHEKRKPIKTELATVQVWIDNGLAEWDHLSGVVTGLDEQHLKLRHALWGEIELPRTRLRRIQHGLSE